MFETTFKLTEQELYKSLVALSRSRVFIKAFRIIGIFLLVIAAVTSVSFITTTTFTVPGFQFFFTLLFAIYITFLPEISGKIQTKKLIKENAQITEVTTYTFDETSFQLAGESFQIWTSYNKLYEVKQVGELILFRMTEGSANILPKRALSLDQFNELKQLIRSTPNLKSTFKA